MFGFTPEDATEISKLVLEGKKLRRGRSCGPQADGKALPRIGDFWIVVDGDHNPVCVIRTSSVEVIPYSQVGEEYAHWGGEGDRTHESWRRMYWQYICQECERIGRQPTTTHHSFWNFSKWCFPTLRRRTDIGSVSKYSTAAGLLNLSQPVSLTRFANTERRLQAG